MTTVMHILIMWWSKNLDRIHNLSRKWCMRMFTYAAMIEIPMLDKTEFTTLYSLLSIDHPCQAHHECFLH